MKPFKSVPVLKEKIWGGQRLKQYNKSFEAEKIGESWETDIDSMPVLIKLIDAEEILSVQVHPDDSMAWQFEQQINGKTEAWIVLECDEGAELVAGIKNGINRAQLEQALLHGSIESCLKLIKVKRGDCIYIPAGTVHSLGKGIVVYEVQQPSDLTYRLYDWDRVYNRGQPRELHIQKALQCINYNSSGVESVNIYDNNLQPMQLHSLFKCRSFGTGYVRIERDKCWSYMAKGYTAVTVLSGSTCISYSNCTEHMYKGDTWIFPGDFQGQIKLHTAEKTEAVITTV